MRKIKQVLHLKIAFTFVNNFGVSKEMNENSNGISKGRPALNERKKQQVIHSNRTLTFINNFGITKEMNEGYNGI